MNRRLEDINLVELVRNDITDFLTNNEELLFNERDLQMHLALYLKDRGLNKYDDIDLEYYVPYSELSNYIWKNELKLDIVVKKDEEFLPIELKYKTKSVPHSLSRFNETTKDTDILKNQGAQDIGCYDLWKDVRRIELVQKRFKAVKSGLAVFVTNDNYYWKDAVKETSAYCNFNLASGVHSRSKSWIKPVKIEENRPSFEVNQEYSILWKDACYGGIPFKFFTIVV